MFDDWQVMQADGALVKAGAGGGGHGPVVSALEREALGAILDPGVALVIWQRAPSVDLAQAIRGLDLSCLADVHAQLNVSGGAAQSTAHLEPQLAAAGYGAEAAGLMAQDIVALAGLLAGLSGEQCLKIRLQTVSTDACRKLHADYVTLRLLTTYCGPGTQWAPAATPEALQAMDPGWVAVLKGRLLLEPPTVLHRSPPIAGSGKCRLVLAIDPLSDQPDGHEMMQPPHGGAYA